MQQTREGIIDKAAAFSSSMKGREKFHQTIMLDPELGVKFKRLCVEGVGAGAPPGQDHGETDGLEDTSNTADGDGVERSLLGEELRDDLCVWISKSGLSMRRYDV